MQGAVKWFDKTKGYGFIRPDDPEEPDRFLHISGWTALVAPEPDMRVEFELEQGRKGLECHQVRLVDADAWSVSEATRPVL